MVIKGTTRVYGIIGCPVKHSLSPVMQNQAFAACGMDAVYIPWQVTPEHLGDAVNGLRALGVCGFNVTIPHKTAILPLLDELDESAARAEAVNTVRNDGGKLLGFNTDGDGLVKSLQTDLDCSVSGKSVVIAGAGGAARGAVPALCRAGAKKIAVANRSAGPARNLVDLMRKHYSSTELLATDGYDAFPDLLADADILINTTSLGMNNEKIPYLNFAATSKNLVVYDMVYSPPVTPLLTDAALTGLRGCNGLGMLAAQGELAFAIWTGQAPPLGLMKQSLQAILSP